MKWVAIDGQLSVARPTDAERRTVADLVTRLRPQMGQPAALRGPPAALLLGLRDHATDGCLTFTFVDVVSVLAPQGRLGPARLALCVGAIFTVLWRPFQFWTVAHSEAEMNDLSRPVRWLTKPPDPGTDLGACYEYRGYAGAWSMPSEQAAEAFSTQILCGVFSIRLAEWVRDAPLQALISGATAPGQNPRPRPTGD